MAEPSQHQSEPRRWSLTPKTFRRLGVGFGVLLAVLVLLDAVVVHHGDFGVDGTFGFHAWYGLGVAAAFIIFAKVFAVFVKRPEDYYDD